MTLDTQFLTMISMVIGGVYLGFAHDTFRRISVSWKSRTLLVYIFEVFFWMMQTTILFLVLYKVNNGEIRFYIFLACLLGFSIYVVLFRSMYQRMLETVLRIVKRVAYFVVRTVEVFVIKPINWILAIIVTLITYVINIGLSVISLLLKIVLYPFHLLWTLLKKVLPESFLKKCNNFYAFYSTIVYKLKTWIKALVLKRR